MKVRFKDGVYEVDPKESNLMKFIALDNEREGGNIPYLGIGYDIYKLSKLYSKVRDFKNIYDATHKLYILEVEIFGYRNTINKINKKIKNINKDNIVKEVRDEIDMIDDKVIYETIEDMESEDGGNIILSIEEENFEYVICYNLRLEKLDLTDDERENLKELEKEYGDNINVVFENLVNYLDFGDIRFEIINIFNNLQNDINSDDFDWFEYKVFYEKNIYNYMEKFIDKAIYFLPDEGETYGYPLIRRYRKDNIIRKIYMNIGAVSERKYSEGKYLTNVYWDMVNFIKNFFDVIIHEMEFYTKKYKNIFNKKLMYINKYAPDCFFRSVSEGKMIEDVIRAENLDHILSELDIFYSDILQYMDLKYGEEIEYDDGYNCYSLIRVGDKK